MFIHEAFHQKNRHKYGPLIYNIFFGFINRFPIYLEDRHFYHHKIDTYGTRLDPDYDLYFDKPLRNIIAPMIFFIIAPLLLMIRFGFLPVLYPILGSKIKFWLYQNFSTITSRVDYKREPINDSDLNNSYKQDIFCGIYMLIILTLIVFGILPVAYLFVHYIVTFILIEANFIRTLGNHYYQSKFVASNKLQMVEDTLTTEDTFVGVTMFPVGLNFHTLHHIYPSLPYYNLKKLHAIIKAKLVPDDNVYTNNIKRKIIRFIINAMKYGGKK